jgi:hypothetical protein
MYLVARDITYPFFINPDKPFILQLYLKKEITIFHLSYSLSLAETGSTPLKIFEIVTNGHTGI